MNPRYSKKTDRLYLQMYPMLFEYARSSLSSDALAEEAVQDSFMMTGPIFRMFPTRELLASTTKHMSASGPEKMVAAYPLHVGCNVSWFYDVSGKSTVPRFL